MFSKSGCFFTGAGVFETIIVSSVYNQPWLPAIPSWYQHLSNALSNGLKYLEWLMQLYESIWTYGMCIWDELYQYNKVFWVWPLGDQKRQ